MVATVFRGDRSDGPYLTRFGYHGTHFLLDGGYRPHDDREVGFPISERKTTQTPHPSARDGSGIPILRMPIFNYAYGAVVTWCQWLTSFHRGGNLQILPTYDREQTGWHLPPILHRLSLATRCRSSLSQKDDARIGELTWIQANDRW